MDDRFAPLTADEIAAARAPAFDAVEDAPDNAARIAKAKAIVQACRPISGTPAEPYLGARGIDVSALPPGTVGWHEESRALVFPIRNDGVVTGCQRLFFDKHGNPRLDEAGKKVRRTNGILTGAALRLHGKGDVLICEGAEDGLSLWQATGQPVRVAFGTGNLGKVSLPERAQTVIVADNDGPGIDAARKAAEKLVALGHEVKIAIPPDVCKDANAVHIKHGEDAIRAMVAAAALYNNGEQPEEPGIDDGPEDRSKPNGHAGANGGAGFSENDWPEPRPIKSSLPGVEPLKHELLPRQIADYVFDVADRQQAPPDFAAVTALCGLSSLAGNKVRVRPKKHDDWKVVPNLWGAIIGRPSAMKSPAMRSALAPLYALEKELNGQWEEEKREADIDAKMAELDEKRAQSAVKKAMNKGDRAEARRLLQEAIRPDAEDIPVPRVVVNDSTVEKLGVLLNENPRGLLLVRDELPGLLSRLESDEYQSDRAFYLESYNGDGSFVYDRIGRGTVRIEHCTISIVGAVQPSRFIPLISDVIVGKNDDGLVQRFQLAVWPDDVGSWEWIDRSPDVRARCAYEKAFRDLHDLTWRRNEHLELTFDAPALALFKQWMGQIQAEARSGKLSSALESHILKFPKTACSIAALFEIISGGRESIGLVASSRAFEFMDYLKTHATRVYSADRRAAESGAALIIERHLQLPNPFSLRHVHQKGWAGLGCREIVEAAIDLLVESGHVRAVTKPTAETGGRPTMLYAWHPLFNGG